MLLLSIIEGSSLVGIAYHFRSVVFLKGNSIEGARVCTRAVHTRVITLRHGRCL